MQIVDGQCFEIVDEHGTVLDVVKFRDAMRLPSKEGDETGSVGSEGRRAALEQARVETALRPCLVRAWGKLEPVIFSA